jgi:hypothetical protein
VAVISHWNAEVEADPDWLIEEPAFEILKPVLAEAFTEIEKWDLLVGKASISVEKTESGPRLKIHVLPTEVRPDGKGPTAIVHSADCCPECYMPRHHLKIHPDNGCPYSIVEQVMLT